MGDENAASVAGVKSENEYFDEYNQQEPSELNDESSQQNRNSKEKDPNNEDQLDEERDSNDEEEEEEEEDESDDDITITINDLNTTPSSSANQNTSFSSTYQTVNLSLNKRAPSFGPGGQVTNLNAAAKPKATGLDIEAAGQYNGQSIFDLNLDSLEDKPWRKPGADITDYFNYGFNEETWKIYCDRQRRLRNEISSSGEPNGGDRVLMPPINNNQNGNNIVLRTFPNNNQQLTNSVPSTSGGNLQHKNEPSLISSVNENSKYGGMLMPKKAGPPPGRKQFGQIEVINSGSQAVQQANQQQLNQQMPPQQQMLMQPNNMNNLQQRGLKSENFIQVIGNRPPMPVPNNNMPPFNMQPPPFGIPPNMEFHGNHPMMNQMNFPPDFMNQPPIRFPMVNPMDMMGNQPPPFDDPQQANNMFRDQDQDDRRREDYSHRSGPDRPNRNYPNRDYRDNDYRRRDDYDGRSSRDKDYESGSSRRRERTRDSHKDRSRSKSKERQRDKEKRRSRERSKERRSHKERDRYKDRESDSSRHKGGSNSGGSHKRSKVKEEQEDL